MSLWSSLLLGLAASTVNTMIQYSMQDSAPSPQEFSIQYSERLIHLLSQRAYLKHLQEIERGENPERSPAQKESVDEADRFIVHANNGHTKPYVGWSRTANGS